MKNESVETDETVLRRILHEARPEPALPTRFQDGVWRRIERGDIRAEHLENDFWLDRLVILLVRPRLAIAGVAAILLIGGVVGAVDGSADARETARDRYVTLVAPQVIR